VTSSALPAIPTPHVGRPRSERARLATLDAAADLLVEGGLPAATMEAIAARAGVSKVTIYSYVDTGDVRADLTTQIRLLLRSFRSRAGEIMAELIGQAQSDPALADTLRTGWLLPRREATATVLRQAVARSQIRADIDIATVMDQLYAPLYWRLMMGHQPLEDGFADELVRNILEGVAVHPG